MSEVFVEEVIKQLIGSLGRRIATVEAQADSLSTIVVDQRDVVVQGLARRICELEAARAKLEAQRPLAVFDDGVAINHHQRIEALERQAHGTHSRHEEPTPNEQALHLRLAALEHQDLAKRITHLEETAVKRDMARGLDFEQVHPDEMMRLRRIERAACDVFEQRLWDMGNQPELAALSRALSAK